MPIDSVPSGSLGVHGRGVRLEGPCLPQLLPGVVVTDSESSNDVVRLRDAVVATLTARYFLFRSTVEPGDEMAEPTSRSIGYTDLGGFHSEEEVTTSFPDAGVDCATTHVVIDDTTMFLETAPHMWESMPGNGISDSSCATLTWLLGVVDARGLTTESRLGAADKQTVIASIDVDDAAHRAAAFGFDLHPGLASAGVEGRILTDVRVHTIDGLIAEVEVALPPRPVPGVGDAPGHRLALALDPTSPREPFRPQANRETSAAELLADDETTSNTGEVD